MQSDFERIAEELQGIRHELKALVHLLRAQLREEDREALAAVYEQTLELRDKAEAIAAQTIPPTQT